MNTIGPCVGETCTPGVVQFDPAGFITLYPMFATVAPAALTNNFGLATLLLDNTCCSVVEDANQRSTLLNLLTAHVTALINGVNGDPPQGMVGRLSDATEGSVSARTEWASQVSQSQAYFSQTQWGASFWQMTVQFRSARYYPPRHHEFESPWDAWQQ